MSNLNFLFYHFLYFPNLVGFFFAISICFYSERKVVKFIIDCPSSRYTKKPKSWYKIFEIFMGFVLPEGKRF